MISDISLMFIYYVYVHMCVCLHAETASSRGLLEVTVRYSYLCVDNLLFHHNEKKLFPEQQMGLKKQQQKNICNKLALFENIQISLCEIKFQ